MVFSVFVFFVFLERDKYCFIFLFLYFERDNIVGICFFVFWERQATFSDGGLVICGPPGYKHANGPLFRGHKGPPGEDSLTLNTESLPRNMNFIREIYLSPHFILRYNVTFYTLQGHLVTGHFNQEWSRVSLATNTSGICLDSWNPAVSWSRKSTTQSHGNSSSFL